MIVTLKPHMGGAGRHVFHVSRGNPAPCLGLYCTRCMECAGPGRCRECNREALEKEKV